MSRLDWQKGRIDVVGGLMKVFFSHSDSDALFWLKADH